MQVTKHASEFETQGRRHQKSKTGISVAPQKGLMSSKIKKKSAYFAHLTALYVYKISKNGLSPPPPNPGSASGIAL